MSEAKELTSLDEFLFDAPLYAEYDLPEDMQIVERLYGRAKEKRIDGFCSYCCRETTFDIQSAHCPGGTPWDNIRERYSHDRLAISCVRNAAHQVDFYFRILRMKIQKIGQFPSLATIANDEVKPYRKYMSKIDGAEFYTAVGLAAHGVGVGSFVYLRRVFERLIESRFQNFKGELGVREEEFTKFRMVDRVALLKDHLPSFLVENARMYSILSAGVHELDEADCLRQFEMLKYSIMVILEEDKDKREQLALREKLSIAIAESMLRPAPAPNDATGAAQNDKQ